MLKQESGVEDKSRGPDLQLRKAFDSCDREILSVVKM